jgi:CubicO group peptidase (beta-lactamase class C family)
MAALDEVARWPGQYSAAAVTNAHETIADAGDRDRRHEWASVTKLLTAYRILQLTESGEVSLGEPAGPPGSTVRHLLAHASGLPFEAGERQPAITKPGQRRIYSNAGFDVLGDLVEQRGGQPFADEIATWVLGPLGMSTTTIAGPASSGAVGSLVDLMRFGRELLAPTLISARTLAIATEVTFPRLDGILPGFGRQTPNDWGLGFELRDSKDPHWTGHTNSPSTFGHFGRSGSFLWVDPPRGLACGALAGVDFGPWAAQAWPGFSDAVIVEYG